MNDYTQQATLLAIDFAIPLDPLQHEGVITFNALIHAQSSLSF